MDGSEEPEERDPFEAWLDRSWEWLVVAGLGVFMLLSRLRTYGKYNTEGDVWFFGTDAYYHTRHLFYTVANFPRTLGFDALTQYPLGTNPGQFGTLFEQIAAAMAWVTGLVVDQGVPTRETILDVMTAYPAILGALAIVPIYMLVRDLYGRRAAIFSAVIAALIPGSFLIRTIAGFSDHHAIEILLSTTAVWAAHRAFRAWEDRDLDLDTLAEDPLVLYREHRPALAVSLWAALAFWAYLAAWPPGVLFVGIVGLWLAGQTLAEVARDKDPVDPIVTGATMFAFVSVLMVPYAIGSPKGGFSALNFTWMQPVAPLLVSLALVALGGLAVLWDREELPAPAYPVAAVGAGLGALGVLWVVLPDLVGQTLSGLSWVTGIGVDPTRRTIAEAQPASFDELGSQFGWLYISAAAGFAWAVGSIISEGERRTDILLVVWAIIATSGTFTQSRFLYYLAVVVIVLNGFLAARTLDLAATFAKESSGDEDAPAPSWSGYHTVAVAILAFFLIPTNVTGFVADCGEGTNAWTQAGCFGGPGESKIWEDQLSWMRKATPQPPLDLNDSFEPPPRGERYDYPEGMYGVLSWWDYGHQIEFDGGRAPIANPFQQQAPLASQIFTSDTEAQALDILDEYLGEENDARYLMIDDQMVSTKFGAITVWAGVEDTYRQGERKRFQLDRSNETTPPLPTPGDTVRGWFLQEIYFGDATGMHHFRLVREHPQFSLIGNTARTQEGQARISGYNTLLGRGSWQNFEPGFDMDKAYQLRDNRLLYGASAESRLKTFERVPGAELTGTGDPGATVQASVPLVSRTSGRTFTYEVNTTIGPDGSYGLTVPYSTTDPVPVSEGGTALSVTARAPYTVAVGNQTTQVDVPDRAVLEGREVPVR